ncbi:MAG TPA: serine hydrolase domain-containing protein [Candidatus Baltobacteraceae bacterium]|nr:serine hydrolase domain-containing protein [Candidatus Baltobacteraceae bacterium]
MGEDLTRGDMLRAAGAAALATAVQPLTAAAAASDATASFGALDGKIKDAMARYHIPGVAIAVWYNGEEYVRGYGVTNVDYPQPVDGNTLFRIGSITKTFTGTTLMRLVDSGKIQLDAPVRTYLPGLTLADKNAARRVTVRQLLNHSAGWMGDDYAGYGRGDNALALYVKDMRLLPQLTPPGKVFAYNNAAVNLAGRVLEVTSGTAYEQAVQNMLLKPLGLRHSGFFADELIGHSFAASHDTKNGKPVVTDGWYFPRSLDSTGGLISSAQDQLRYARFHLGNGSAYDGARVLSANALHAMHSHPGPGGTIVFEIDGVVVSFWQRRTAQGIPVLQHGGSWGGQNSDLIIVPQRNFAMSILTNSTNGGKLIADVSYSGWALNRFAGLSNPPAVPKRLSAAQLRKYEGRYRGWVIPPDTSPKKMETLKIEVRAHDGGLRVTGDVDQTMAFYRGDYVLTTAKDGQTARSDFVRDPAGNVAWFRDRGRLYARQP